MSKKSVLTSVLATIIYGSLFLSSSALFSKTASQDQVLVTIDDATVTRGDLQTALSSSPFYTQFNTLDETTQASMRGDLLKRLVSSKLLAAEAKKLGLENSPGFKKELDEYAKGLLYRAYTHSLKNNIQLSEQELKAITEKYKGHADNLSASKSSLIAKKYKALLKLTLLKLRESWHVKVYENKINKDVKADTVLMEGDNGLKLTYADIVDVNQYPQTPNKEAIQEILYQRIEYLLITKAAESEKIDVSQELSRYKEQRLPALLVEKKAQEWIANEKVLKDYFELHPEIGVVSDQWHIGQLVLKSQEEAEKAKAMIDSGKKSLFELASEISIDPYGKEKKGDMGWVKQGTGMPAIEKVLKDLNDQELSPIIKTDKGYHLVTILKRKPGRTLGFGAVKDKIKQRIISEKMSGYLQTLQSRHKVTWHVMETNPTKAEALAKSKNISP